MKIYLAGPMRGAENYNFPLFDHVAEQLRQQGHEVFNPADLTRDIFGGLEPFLAMPLDEQHGAVRQLLAKELFWICRQADAVYLLPGWQDSLGATAERTVAMALDLEVVEVPEKMLNLQVD